MVNLNCLYNPEPAKIFLDRDCFLDKKLSFQVIEHGVILPYKKTIEGKPRGWGFGGIVDGAGNFVKGSHVTKDVGDAYTPAELIQRRSKTVIYLGMFHSTWGHVITDNIRRLWFLKSEFISQFKGCPLVYLICSRIKTFTLEDYKNFKRLLEILEVDLSRLQLIEQSTQFERIILPDESFSGGKFTKEYRETIERVKHFALKNRTTIPNKKIYYLHGTRQIGEEHVAQYFKSKGYEIIRPEKLTLDEQLNILINAESFASVIGSTSHNSVFLRKGTETILIPRQPTGFANNYQRELNQVNSIKVSYVDSTLSLFSDGYFGACFIVSAQLKRFFGDKFDGYSEEDFKTFLQYVKNFLSRGIVGKAQAKKYYSPILPEFIAKLKQHKDLITAYDMPPRWEKFRPVLIYQTHVAKKGWGAWFVEAQISNLIEDKLDIQAIKINFPGHKIYYSVYFNKEEGWSQEVIAPEMAGTIGKFKPIYGMRVRLDEAGSKEFDILYRMHKFDGTWTSWAKNGEALYSYGQKINAIQIKLEAKTA